MSQLVKLTLPKVQFRVKTTPSPTQPQPPQLFKQQTHPLHSRLKMKKEIQESYIRFRRHKKNNYIKHFATSKRTPNPEDKRAHTIELKKKNSQHRIAFALQAHEVERPSLNPEHRQQENPTSLSLLRKLRQSLSNQNRESLSSSLKPQHSKQNFLPRDLSLYDSQLCGPNDELQLQGQRWNYSNNRFSRTKKMFANLLKLNTTQSKHPSGKSSAFRIEAWKADKVEGSKNYYEFEQIEID